MSRTELDGEFREKHRYRYWTEHSKEDYECPDCGRRLRDVHSFEVHHKDGDPRNGSPENLIGLCRKCHYERHGRTPPESLSEWKARVEEL